MESDTAWPTSRRKLLPSSFEWRLLQSYLTIFVLVLIAFAVAIHVAFANLFDREATERLRTMLNTAASVVDASSTGVSVDLKDESIRGIDPAAAGLLWIRPAGSVVASYGTSKGLTHAPSSAIVRRAVVGDLPQAAVKIEAALDRKPYISRLRTVDVTIFGAFALAVAGSLVAGRWLTRRLVRELRSNMQVLEEFSADAAHELRGPLTAITVNAGTAAAFDPEHVIVSREAMDSIVSAASQMTRVSEDLLTLARATQPFERDLFAVDLVACIRSAAELYAEPARRCGVRLEHRDGEQIEVYGNPTQIERIVVNLVQNAIRYTPSGGTVSLACAKARAGARITIEDTGLGIAPEHVARIFDRFWRADDSRADLGGSGLGLTIARQLARRHGGDISVRSQLGAGSTFTVFLPERPPRTPRSFL